MPHDVWSRTQPIPRSWSNKSQKPKTLYATSFLWSLAWITWCSSVRDNVSPNPGAFQLRQTYDYYNLIEKVRPRPTVVSAKTSKRTKSANPIVYLILFVSSASWWSLLNNTLDTARCDSKQTGVGKQYCVYGMATVVLTQGNQEYSEDRIYRYLPRQENWTAVMIAFQRDKHWMLSSCWGEQTCSGITELS